VAYCLGELDTTSVKIPVIFPETPYARFLEEHATPTPEGAVVFSPYDVRQFDDALATFQALNQMKKSLERYSRQFEEVLRSLMVSIAETVQAVTEVKISSTNKIMERSNRLLFTILKAPYNHYSPKLEAEEIERIRNESFDYEDSVDSYLPLSWNGW
jgi:hypothetical protein